MLIGINYEKFKHNYQPSTFYGLAKLLQKKLNSGVLEGADLQRTYNELFEQESLTQVFDLFWMKRHKKKFEEENEEVSLMVKPKVQNGMVSHPKPAKEERKGDHESSNGNIPSFLMEVDPEEVKAEPAPMQEMVKEVKSDTYQELLKLQEQEDKARRQAEEEENQRLIEQIMKEEEERQWKLEAESALAAQQLAEQLEKEAEEKRKEEEEKNKPECKICFDTIEFEEIMPLACGHIYHPQCIAPHIKARVEDKHFPIPCPDPECGLEMSDAELQLFCDGEQYEKLLKFQFELCIEQNNEMFNHCPTADCPFVFAWDGDKENQRFQCGICNKTYCIMCRVDWHEDMNCQEYRELNGYPPEDRLFIKFIKGTQFKQCPKCKFWVEKSSGCDHMTCRCRFEF
jgi:ariadne-1